ncbi:MFS transporter [Chromobacterium sp. ATCC 53434]|uniref:MFS transporter n=1 Tax=Chromobacterium sp. (strain ATCC 53434 / SC 14030) TaxID=2059672 RepID=UPI000C76A692|nr:MFS transporter [Chromobacterium sp. ATCC 53434]AUH53539.1 MFS transporter [Chromobacterium sp. ATCC 53434]
MENPSVELKAELAEAPVGKLHRKLGAAMAALTLFDGYDTFNPAYVIHYVREPWLLSPQQAGMLVSSGLIGFLFGAALHGGVADRFGRRVTLLGGLWIITVFSLLTALLADSFTVFCALRVATGLGLGVLLPLSTTYINELAPRRTANAFSLWGVAFGWALGGTMAGVVGVFLTPVIGWQGLYWVGGLSALLLPVLHRHLPESPQFLLMRGDDAAVRDLLSRLRPERAKWYSHASIQRATHESKPSMLALLAPGYRRLTLAIWTASFLSLFSIFGLSAWIPSLMLARGETFGASFGYGALLQIASFAGGLACGHLIDQYGFARGWLALWWLAGSASVFALLFSSGHIANIVISAVAGFGIIGAQFVLNNFTAAAYPTSVRATGVGMELAVGRLGAILGPYIGGLLQQHHRGPRTMLLSIGIACIGAALAALAAKQPAHRAARPGMGRAEP